MARQRKSCGLRGGINCSIPEIPQILKFAVQFFFSKMSIKHELQNIISGNGSVRNGEIIQTITRFLRGKKETSSGIGAEEFNKKQEESFLREFISHTPKLTHQILFSRICQPC